MGNIAFAIILFFNAFLGGLTVPVISLIFLDKGLSLPDLSIFLGLYSLVIIFAEVPTGILADTMGRKKIFSISLVGTILSSFFLLLGKRRILLFVAIAMAGLSRAFASGSLDALYVDHSIAGRKDGVEKIAAKVTANISILETLGLALGSTLGGFLPVIANKYFKFLGTYDLNLLLKIALTIPTLVMTWVWIREYETAKSEERFSLKNRIVDAVSLMQRDTILRSLFLSVFSTGFFLFSLETYWQPRLVSLIPNDSFLWILGVMSGIYYISAIGGNMIAQRCLAHMQVDMRRFYVIFRVCLAGALLLMALQKNLALFLFGYACVYLCLGICNVPEGAILHSRISSENRASFLSITSLIAHIGALSSSFVNTVLIGRLSIPGIWLIGSTALLLSSISAGKRILVRNDEL